LLAYRNRPSVPLGGFYVAQRQDILRKGESGWRLARRLVQLDQTMLFDGSLSTIL
jgi:3-phenylpropionate/cinnamic acid dioxygenase small subunit